MEFSLALFLPAHGEVNHLDGLLLERRLIDPVDYLLETGVILVRLDPHLEGLLKGTRGSSLPPFLCPLSSILIQKRQSRVV
jgi:hypothetical protein